MDRSACASTGREIVFSRFRKATDIRCGKYVVRNIRRTAESPDGSGERAVCGFAVPEQGRCRVLCSDSSRQECMKKEVSGMFRTLFMFRVVRRAIPGCGNATSFARRRTFPVLIPFLIRILLARSYPKFGAGVHDAGRRGDDPMRTAEAYGPGECRKEKNFSSFDFRAISVGQRGASRDSDRTGFTLPFCKGRGRSGRSSVFCLRYR